MKTILRNLTLFSIALSSLLLTPSAYAADAAEVLARVKETTGGAAWGAVKTLHTRARITTSGLSGTADIWEDVRTGRFYTTFKIGPVSGAEGYDGKTAWTQDSSGQSLEDDAGERAEGTRTFRVLTVKPAGGRPFEMWIDTATWRIDRTIEKTARDTRTTFFSDYRKVGGLEFPFAERQTNGEAKYDQVVAIESVEVDAPVDEAKFSRPEGSTGDFAIAGGGSSAGLPFELLNNHLYVEARLNGKAPLRMLFDTSTARARLSR